MQEKRLWLLLLLFSFYVSAQMKCVIKDSITGKEISYVGVWEKNSKNAYSSDKNGKLKFKNTVQDDELTFYTTGYEEKKTAISKLPKEVFLVPVTNKTDSNSLELTEETYVQNDDFDSTLARGFYTVNLGTHLVAKYVPYYPQFIKTPFLKSIQFGVNSLSRSALYKLRFFEADSLGKPSREIGTQDIICKSKRSVFYKGPEELFGKIDNGKAIDLTKYKIRLPKTGIFVAIEILDIPKNNYDSYWAESTKSNIIFPVVLMKPSNSGFTWGFTGGNWNPSKKNSDLALKLILTN